MDALLARSDISAVIVVLPITLQPAIIIKALAAGKHVLSEKPVAADVAKGLDLIKTYNTVYKGKGLIWRVAENFEAEPGYQAAAAAVRSGKIGEVKFFKTVVVNYIDKESKWYQTPWRTVPDVSRLSLASCWKAESCLLVPRGIPCEQSFLRSPPFSDTSRNVAGRRCRKPPSFALLIGDNPTFISFSTRLPHCE